MYITSIYIYFLKRCWDLVFLFFKKPSFLLSKCPSSSPLLFTFLFFIYFNSITGRVYIALLFYSIRSLQNDQAQLLFFDYYRIVFPSPGHTLATPPFLFTYLFLFSLTSLASPRPSVFIRFLFHNQK